MNRLVMKQEPNSTSGALLDKDVSYDKKNLSNNKEKGVLKIWCKWILVLKYQVTETAATKLIFILQNWSLFPTPPNPVPQKLSL